MAEKKTEKVLTEEVKEELVEETLIEEVDPDQEEFFPDGPTVGTIKEWCKEYEVYAMEFNEETSFFYRPISRSEFKQINMNDGINTLVREEIMCQIATLWPEDYNFAEGLGGVATVLAESIMAKSGFAPTVEAISMNDLLSATEENE